MIQKIIKKKRFGERGEEGEEAELNKQTQYKEEEKDKLPCITSIVSQVSLVDPCGSFVRKDPTLPKGNIQQS